MAYIYVAKTCIYVSLYFQAAADKEIADAQIGFRSEVQKLEIKSSICAVCFKWQKTSSFL